MSASFVRKDIKLDQAHFDMLRWLRENVYHDTFPVQTMRRLVRAAAEKHGFNGFEVSSGEAAANDGE